VSRRKTASSRAAMCGLKSATSWRSANGMCQVYLQVTRWLYCVDAHYTVFDSKCSAIRAHIHKLFTLCIRRGLVSRDSIVDGDWLPATKWCQLCLPCCQPASEVAHKFGKVSCQECTGQANDGIVSNGRNWN